MDFIIRRAMPDDADVACKVLRRSIEECCVEDHHRDPGVLSAWLANKTPENLRSWFQSRRYAVVTERQGQIVGIAMLGGNGTIALCYIVAEVRFLGIGKAMLAALEEEARRRGLNFVELGSTKTAYAFYKRNGYVDTGKDESAFGLTARGMQKDLARDLHKIRDL
jgi:GNAT superfamily N-acetyltransferase